MRSSEWSAFNVVLPHLVCTPWHLPVVLRPSSHQQLSNFYELCHHRSADFDTVRQIKERLCFMAFDLEQEIQVRTRRDGPLNYRCGSCSSCQTERHLAQHGISCALCMLCTLCSWRGTPPAPLRATRYQTGAPSGLGPSASQLQRL